MTGVASGSFARPSAFNVSLASSGPLRGNVQRPTSKWMFAPLADGFGRRGSGGGADAGAWEGAGGGAWAQSRLTLASIIRNVRLGTLVPPHAFRVTKWFGSRGIGELRRQRAARAGAIIFLVLSTQQFVPA